MRILVTILSAVPVRRSVAAVAVSVLALFFAAGALAEGDTPFAALDVRSNGKQVIDITTGITTLPDGGSVIDKETGVSFTAGHIEYLDGAFIEATGVQLEGAFGKLAAERVRIDISDSTLLASGDLVLSRAGLQVVAKELHYYAVHEIAVFEGGVTGNEPNFNAERVLLDVRSGDVLLDGQYSFAGELFTMNSPADGGQLELRLVENGDLVTYSAATEVSAALLERFRAYL